MSDLNPIENELQKDIIDLRSRLRALETARQPYIGDWRELSVSTISYLTSSTINITDTYIVEVLLIGDKIKLTQTIDKYFYVTNISGTVITLFAGDNYSLTNTPITYFANSRLENPSGHPIVFSRTIPASEISGSSGTISGQYGSQYTYMRGSYVYVNTEVHFSVDVQDEYILVKHPILRVNPANYYGYNIYTGIGDDGIYRFPTSSTWGGFSAEDFLFSESLITLTGYNENFWNVGDYQTLTYNYFYAIDYE